jgi:WD40 repeat protein/DNA-binding SARP family transcriptional activator
MPHLSICLLGTYQVTRGSTLVTEFASNKVRGLLAYLAVEANRPHSREALAALLWPDSPQESALSSLRNGLANLRGAIGDREAHPAYLLITRDTVQFNLCSDYHLDVENILGLRAVHQSLRTHCQPTDLERHIAAVNGYRGPFLAGFSIPDSAVFEEWASLWRERLGRAVLEELRRLADFYEACAEFSPALEYAQRQVALDPWLEESQRQVMRILALSGQRSAALAQYETCRRALVDGLGIDPSPQTRQLYESIRVGQLQTLRSDPVLPTPGVSPYRGLCFFDESDAPLFFGREALSVRLVSRVAEVALSSAPQLAVVGASGSGKSSLVRAGVTPLLRKAGWDVDMITPTTHPLTALQASRVWSQPANRSSCQHLLIIDQFEELFCLCRTEGEREAFLEWVFELNRPVLFVLRADFYGHCAVYPHLRAMLSAHQEYIGAMDASGLRRAIEEPARRGGWELEPGLVDLLLNEMNVSGDHLPEAGALPLLEHALLETWQRRRGRVLTLAGYQESGGIRGAIAQTAERVYARLSSAEQTLARRVFLRLTEMGVGTQDTRRRAPLDELRAIGKGDNQVDGLLDGLVAARLVTLAEETAEVTHEALIREWPALRTWLADDRDGLRLHRHLTESAAAWERFGRDPGELYRGARLAQAREWAGQAEHEQELTPLEREFIRASRALEEWEALEREVQRQHELEAARQLAETERQRAEERAHAAKQLYCQERLSYARELSAYSKNKLGTEPDLSLLLALEAVAILKESGQPVPWDVQQAIHDVALTSRLVWSRETSSLPWCTFYAPDGKRVLYEDAQDAYILDAITGEELLGLRAGGSINANFSPDGKWVATANATRACLWDAGTGERLVTFPLPGLDPCKGKLNAISPDGKLLHVNIDETTGMLLDLRPWLDAGSPSVPTFPLPMKRIERCSWDTPGVAFSPDGKIFTTPWLADNSYILWDTATVQPLRAFVGHRHLPMDISFSPDGLQAASCSFDRTVRVWDVESAKELLCLVGHTNLVSCIAYSPDGLRLASSGTEGVVIVWDVAGGRKLFDLPTGSLAFGVAFSPDGEHLITSAQTSRSVQLWDSTPCGPGELGSVRLVQPIREPSLDRTRILDLRSDGRVVILDTISFQTLDCLEIVPAISTRECTLRLSGDNNQLLVVNSGNLVIWNLKTREKILERLVEEGDRYSHALAFSPDGTRIAFSINPGKLIVWDLSHVHPDLVLPVTMEGFNTFEFSPNGRFLAAGGFIEVEHGSGGDVWVWDLEQPAQPVTVFRGDLRVIRGLSFSPDNTRLAVCGANSHPEVRDVLHGERILLLQGHTAVVRTIRYSPDGHYLVTASEDGTTKIWDANSGMELLSFHVPGQDLLRSASFTPDGRRVVTIGEDGICRLLAFQNFDDLLDIVHKRVTRTWKLEERRRYLRQDE